MIKVEVTKSEWVHKYGNYTILLKQAGGEGYYPVFVDELEAKLVRALNNQKLLLPYKATRWLPFLLEKAKIEMIKVEIFKPLFGDVSAKVVFRNRKVIKRLTCNTGVAIESALRCDVPIFIEKSLLFEPESAIQKPHYPRNELDSLQRDLQKAIDSEEYEEAARLRDKILKLEENRENKIHA